MVLKNKTIVLLGNTRFDSPIKATSLFIARKLAKENKVYFIDYPFTLKDYFNSVDLDSEQLKQRKQKFSLFSDGLLKTDIENLKIVITPPVIPINFLPEGRFFRILLRINEKIISTRLKKIFNNNNVKDFIYINSFNFHYPRIATKISPTLTVYHCVDPMIVPYDMKHGLKSEQILVKESDLVICTSKALYTEKKSINKDTYFVPNASDFDFSKKENSSSNSIHKKLLNFNGPIIGYLGTIERRIDYVFVEKVAHLNPDKVFIFAGPVSRDQIPDSFFDVPNIHVIGPIPYTEVPQMISSFDIAIIPFKKDEVSNTIFPIKLFEYLSAGKPVVVTNFNTDLKDYTDNQVDFCNDPASFSDSINAALQSNTQLKIENRIALAQKNSWDERANQIAEIINSHLILKKTK